MTTSTLTIDSIITEHAADIAFAAEAETATSPEAFLGQLATAALNLGHFARIAGAEDLDTAHTYLCDALDTTGPDRDALVKKAARYMENTADMVDEYRDMV